jgi:hypothetical protein
VLDLAPVFAADAVQQNNPQQGWRQNEQGQLINNADASLCLTVVKNDNDTCPNGCVWNDAANADEYFCGTGTTTHRLAFTNCSSPVGENTWVVESARFSLILVADVHGPTGCNTSEAAPFLKHMHEGGQVYQRSVPSCGMVQTGTIFNQSVMIAATGIGMMRPVSHAALPLQPSHIRRNSRLLRGAGRGRLLA